jgi:hypothetical protein
LRPDRRARLGFGQHPLAAAELERRRAALAGETLEHPVDVPPLGSHPLAVDVDEDVAVTRHLAPVNVVEGLDESAL